MEKNGDEIKSIGKEGNAIRVVCFFPREEKNIKERLGGRKDETEKVKRYCWLDKRRQRKPEKRTRKKEK